MFVVLVCSEVE